MSTREVVMLAEPAAIDCRECRADLDFLADEVGEDVLDELSENERAHLVPFERRALADVNFISTEVPGAHTGYFLECFGQLSCHFAGVLLVEVAHAVDAEVVHVLL